MQVQAKQLIHTLPSVARFVNSLSITPEACARLDASSSANDSTAPMRELFRLRSKRGGGLSGCVHGSSSPSLVDIRLITFSSNTAVYYSLITGSKSLLTSSQHIVSEPFRALTDRPHKTATCVVQSTSSI